MLALSLNSLPKAIHPTMENLRLVYVAWATAPFMLLLEKYVIPDTGFAICVAILIAYDTILGTWYAWRTNVLSSAGAFKTVTKFIVYAIALGSIHTLTVMTALAGKEDLAGILGYGDSALYLYFAYREIISIGENMGKLGFPLFPAWFMKRLKDFTATGEYKEGSGAGLPVAPSEQPANAPTEPLPAMQATPPVTSWPKP